MKLPNFLPFIEEKANISPHPLPITLGVFEFSLGVFEITLGVSKGALCRLRMVSPQTSKAIWMQRLSTSPMDTLQHSAALSLKGRSSNSQFASIYSHVGNVLFPAWENIIPSLGTNNSFKGSTVTNKAAFFILTARVTRLNLKKTPIRLVVRKIMPKFAAFYNY